MKGHNPNALDVFKRYAERKKTIIKSRINRSANLMQKAKREILIYGAVRI